ncbi:copper resistance protein B [Shewanella sp. SHSM-M6]|uniref:Copper resistance protein B n=2 Tax=Shewanella salipaludis TaxID=2723052 RepID=A0A972FRV3_9GAMM|nr:copper resistance protein B [Shewanella salipaludis]
MNIGVKTRLGVLVATWLLAATAQADEQATPMAMQHEAVPHETMTHEAMSHEAVSHETMSQEAVPHEAMSHETMAPETEEVRDPHAYADGYTLDSGAYALPGPRQLRLADEHAFWSLLFERFEYAGDGSSRGTDTGQYDVQAWYGKTYDRLMLKAEGEWAAGKLTDSETELLWSHAIDSFWDAQLGLRLDSSEGQARQWLALGAQGLAPYWFELDLTAYLGAGGRTALALEAEYELLLSQRLVLQPRAELTLYGRDDEANGIGSGLTDASLGLRLRYEFSRRFAPYIGVEWAAKFGRTADYATRAGDADRDTRYVAGVRFWF